MSSISNMPIVSEGVPMEGTTDYVWDHYQESVKMSTYLVAFVVSKFKYEETTRERIQVFVSILHGKINQWEEGMGRSE